MANNYHPFDSVSYQKYVEDVYEKQKNRSKAFEDVFGDTSRAVRGENGIVKEAMRILSKPQKYLTSLQKKFESAKKKYGL